MPSKLDVFWEGYIVALSDIGFSYSRIIEQCKSKGFIISRNGISKAMKRQQQANPRSAESSTKKRKRHPAPARNTANIRKVKRLVLQEHPPTQRAVAQKVGTSLASVNRIIRRDLKLERKYKAKVHALSPKHIAERRTNSRRLYERHLAGSRWKFIVTLDEAWIYLTHSGKTRAIYYRQQGQKTRSDWVRQCKESFPKGFMVVAGYSYNGRLTIRRVPSNVKVNAAYYQQYILDPIYREDIPRLYGDEMKKVSIHQDKASSHTAKSTVCYFSKMERETGIRAIPYSDIPVKSPDASPMDFCAFGLLKRAIMQRWLTTLHGLWKVCQEEWNTLDMAALQRSLLQWKLRCRAIARRKGFHIEHNRWRRKGFT